MIQHDRAVGCKFIIMKVSQLTGGLLCTLLELWETLLHFARHL